MNPPEQERGVDPDEPGGGAKRAEGTVGAGFGRAEIATHMAAALVASRVYAPTNNRYVKEVAAEAVQLADALLAQLAQ